MTAPPPPRRPLTPRKLLPRAQNLPKTPFPTAVPATAHVPWDVASAITSAAGKRRPLNYVLCESWSPPLPRLLWGFAGTPFLFLFLSLLPLLSVGSYFRWSTFLGSKFSGEAFVSVCSRYCCGWGEGEWKMKDLYVSFFHSHFRKYRILLLWEYSC